MNTTFTTPISIPVWKQKLRSNVTDVATLAGLLELTEEMKSKLLPRPGFSLNVPLRLVNKMAKGTLDDPILRQFLPFALEKQIDPSFAMDPVGDSLCRKAPKLLHKYQGRVLLVCTSACAMHCRYCFRQNFDYATTDKTFEEELKIIAEDATINEVILSGGDPLSLDDRILNALLQNLAAIPHIRKVRFHTRFPIGIPERIDAAFLKMLKETPVQFWFVIHSNHVREWDDDVFAAMKAIQCLGIPILNMSVLLKGVNDTVDALQSLYTALVDHGILPYYLNQLDRVQGAMHFEVPIEQGKNLLNQLEMSLPGYAVPKYIQEIAGASSKTIIT